MIEKRHYVGLFPVITGDVILELSLTRVLSVALWYHFSFLVISTALLGFGAVGRDPRRSTLSFVKTRLLDRALAVAVACVRCRHGRKFLAHATHSVRSLQPVHGSAGNLLFMPAYYLAIATPFYCGGLAVGLLLTRGSGQVNRLYAVDLVGAGPGLRRPLLVIMPALGGSGSVLLAAGIGLIAAAVFGFAQARATSMIALLLGILTFVWIVCR